jgi:hypothetical protein
MIVITIMMAHVDRFILLIGFGPKEQRIKCENISMESFLRVSPKPSLGKPG